MKRSLGAIFALAAFSGLPACAGASSASAAGAPAWSLALATPDLEIRDAKGAFVAGALVPMDGIAEGLAWPALRAALPRKPGDHAPLTIAVARTVPVAMVMRVVWTLRDADLRLQTPDAEGVTRALELRPKPDAPPGVADAVCHLAVFVGANGDLRVAFPGGPHVIHGPDAPGGLARALASEETRCPIRYVAFGADTNDAPWGSVFDVAHAVDRDKAAGNARYVLGEPIQVAAR